MALYIGGSRDGQRFRTEQDKEFVVHLPTEASRYDVEPTVEAYALRGGDRVFLGSAKRKPAEVVWPEFFEELVKDHRP